MKEEKGLETYSAIQSDPYPGKKIQQSQQQTIKPRAKNR